MARLRERVERIYSTLERLDWIPRLLARVSIGIMFAGGAVHKLEALDDFTAYFESLGIPAAELQAPLAAVTELVGGLCLILGVLMRPASLALAIIMVVALFTAAIPEHNITASWSGLLELFYLPEWLLLVLLLWFVCAGAGRASVDAIFRPTQKH
jgi:putative oxidoreductase